MFLLSVQLPKINMRLLAIEKWRVIEADVRYEVSSSGRVRRIDTGRVLKPWTHRSGHLYVSFCLRGKRTNLQVHRLVLTAFTGPCPSGLEGCHKDGVPQNNVSGNLYWGTRAQNINDSVRHRDKFPKSKLTFTQARDIRNAYTGKWGEKRRIASQYGVSEHLIGKLINNKTYTQEEII